MTKDDGLFGGVEDPADFRVVPEVPEVPEDPAGLALALALVVQVVPAVLVVQEDPVDLAVLVFPEVRVVPVDPVAPVDLASPVSPEVLADLGDPVVLALVQVSLDSRAVVLVDPADLVVPAEAPADLVDLVDLVWVPAEDLEEVLAADAAEDPDKLLSKHQPLSIYLIMSPFSGRRREGDLQISFSRFSMTLDSGPLKASRYITKIFLKIY